MAAMLTSIEVARFAIERTEILRPDGEVAAELPAFASERDELARL